MNVSMAKITATSMVILSLFAISALAGSIQDCKTDCSDSWRQCGVDCYKGPSQDRTQCNENCRRTWNTLCPRECDPKPYSIQDCKTDCSDSCRQCEVDCYKGPSQDRTQCNENCRRTWTTLCPRECDPKPYSIQDCKTDCSDSWRQCGVDCYKGPSQDRTQCNANCRRTWTTLCPRECNAKWKN